MMIFSGVRIFLYNVPVAIEKASSLFNILFGTALPFVIIFGCNLLIIITVKRAARERDKLKSSQVEKQQKDSHMTAMLLFVSIAYVVTTLPYRLFDPVMEMPELVAMYDMTQQYWRLRYTVSISFVMNLWFCNYAVNFYLYCIGGGRRYWNDTKAVIGQLMPCIPK
jgi:arginine exporter protein ArgO